jgi:hypothetical protein
LLNQKAREEQKEMDKSIVHISLHFYSPRLKPWAIN